MKIARFEKVSKNRFLEDLSASGFEDTIEYEDILLPQRATSGSAGYDFYSPVQVLLKPGESCRIPSGIRCRIDQEYVLQLYPRSSLGFKYRMRLLNTVGIIDSDYYNADNEGHIIVGVVNEGDRELLIRKNDRFVQGVFYRYYLAEEEENSRERHGGFGSTD